MKKLIFSSFLIVLFLSTTYAQYRTVRTGYEGDYFSLEGALDLFKNSYTLKEFERKLNTEETWVNNLDLNYDGRIDYLRVEHMRDGNFHAIVLQALLGRYDVQDVAVIEIEILGRREAVLQIVGDEDLYGEEVFVEPIEGYADSRRGYHSDFGHYVNVYYWDIIQHLLDRHYHAYSSPYHWQYYPVWWRSWGQCSWNVYRPRVVIYHNHYHVVHRHRVIRVHNYYRNHRSYSNNVVQCANRVRVKHGKQPIHRADPHAGYNRNSDRSPDRRNGKYQSRKDAENRQGNTQRFSNERRNAPVSRKRTVSSSGHKTDRNTVGQVNHSSRKTIGRTETNRVNTSIQKPSVRSRKTTSNANQKTARNTTTQRSRNSTTRTGTTTRSGVSNKRPSSSSKKPSASSSASRVNRNTAQSKRQSSQNRSVRSSTTVRPKAQPKKPSTTSRKSTPASKPNVNKRSTLKKSSSKSASKSRRGG